MLPLGMVLGMLGYGLSSWGYILVKGYNITLREWFTPLHPYTGKLDANGCVPQGSIFPKAGKGGPCSASPGSTQGGDLNPGTTLPGPGSRGVPSRL
jgi:hypothetical protein